MANQKNVRFPFGLLNLAQDATNIKTPEATEAKGLDADSLSLGTLEYIDYQQDSAEPNEEKFLGAVVGQQNLTIDVQSGPPSAGPIRWVSGAAIVRNFEDFFQIPPTLITGSAKVVGPTEVLQDGTYSYKARLRLDDRAEDGQYPQTPWANDIAQVELNDGPGGATPTVTLAAAPTINGVGTKIQLYRAGPDTDGDFVKIYEGIGGTTITDNIAVTSLQQLEFGHPKDEAEVDLVLANDTLGINYAISNNGGWRQLYAFDNRLWRVADGRPNVLLYSRQSAWWGWQRANSFTFDGDIRFIIGVRDPSTVGGMLTKVVFTSEGIYHITGIGVEADPYILVKIVSDIDTFTNSIVNLNGELTFMSQPLAGLTSVPIYERGPYGQKAYRYDLQKLTELSTKLRDYDFFNTSITKIRKANLLASDKYVIIRDDTDELMAYHTDAKGWVQGGAASLWQWESKVFTPEVMKRFQIGYARKFKIDMEGDITITFTYEAFDGSETSVVLNVSSGTRAELVQRLPSFKDRKVRFRVESTSVGAKLYNFYFVT